METVPMNTSGDYNRRIGNPKRSFVTNRSLFPYPSDDLLFARFLAGGHFAGGVLPSIPPANLSHSYPPVVFQNFRQQPPLLPLPITTPVINHRNINIYRSNSTPNNNLRSSVQNNKNVNKNVKNRSRDHSLTPKKSKNQKKNSKREEVDLVPPAVNQKNVPDPVDLPKDVISRVFSSSINNKSGEIVDKFSGSVVFTPSPPPSSLPLPTFSLRPKLSCTAEAAGVDAGATDSLRRLLRL